MRLLMIEHKGRSPGCLLETEVDLPAASQAAPKLPGKANAAFAKVHLPNRLYLQRLRTGAPRIVVDLNRA